MVNIVLEKLFKIISDEKGMPSSMRVYSLIVLLMYALDWTAHIYRCQEFTPSSSSVGVVIAALGAKAVQKKLEK